MFTMYVNQCRITSKLWHEDWAESKNKNAKLMFLEAAIRGVLKGCFRNFVKFTAKYLSARVSFS